MKNRISFLVIVILSFTSHAFAGQECDRASYLSQLVADESKSKTLSGEEKLDRNSNLTVKIESSSTLKVDSVSLGKYREMNSGKADRTFDCRKDLASLK